MSNGNASNKKRSSSSFHFAAGLSSGLTSAVLLQPADLLKTRVQQSHGTTLVETLRSIGAGPSPIRQLWRGTIPSALRTGFGSALYFTTLNSFRQNVARMPLLAAGGNPTTGRAGAEMPKRAADPAASSSNLPKLSNTGNLLTGAFARVFAGFVMMPVTVLKVRYESSLYAYSSLPSACRDIAAKEGLRGFFAGFGVTAVRDAPYAGLYVLFYEQSKRRLSALAARLHAPASASVSAGGAGVLMGGDAPVHAANASLSSSTAASINFTSGMVSSIVSTALTNPFDAIKTRLQLMPGTYKNMAYAARLMLRQEGIASLFDGLGLRIARKGMSSALAWTLYEELIRRAERRFGGVI